MENDEAEAVVESPPTLYKSTKFTMVAMDSPPDEEISELENVDPLEIKALSNVQGDAPPPSQVGYSRRKPERVMDMLSQT